jgi:hypothetical protein
VARAGRKEALKEISEAELPSEATIVRLKGFAILIKLNR